MLNKILLICFVLSGVLIFSGCGENDVRPELDERARLAEEEDSFEREIDQLREENEQLKGQVKALAGIDAEKKLDVLTKLGGIELGRRSGLYDKDEDGRKEKLIVYVRTLDETGDAVKIAGACKVQLWDLGGQADEALVGEWFVEPEDMKMKWAGTMMTSYYRLTFDVGELLKDGQELTVKVNFTDYLTGREFSEQKQIEND
jgi:hypothetical protein